MGLMRDMRDMGDMGNYQLSTFNSIVNNFLRQSHFWRTKCAIFAFDL